MTTYTKYFSAAGITVQVRSEFFIGEHTFHPKFKQFETYGPGRDNVVIQHHFHPPDLSPFKDQGAILIYQNEQWQIQKVRDHWIYDYTPVYDYDRGCDATGIFNSDHSKIHIYAPKLDISRYSSERFQALTLFNSDQVVFSKLLSDRNGIIIHSNGFDMDGKGVLFAGKSGVGKTTLSKMLIQRGYRVLCDDRMFVINSDNGFTLHGNWCHGTVPNVSPGACPLNAVFFLEQSDMNDLVPLTDKSLILQYLTQSMVKPVLGKAGWGNALEILDKMVSTVSCYILKFDLSGRICNLLDEILSKD